MTHRIISHVAPMCSSPWYTRMTGWIEAPQGDAGPRRRVQLTPNRWSKRALCLMAATTGDAWRTIYSDRAHMARQPPSALAQSLSWQQQALTETFASCSPVEVFEGFNFPYIEDAVTLPAFNRCAEWVEGRGIPPGCPCASGEDRNKGS